MFQSHNGAIAACRTSLIPSLMTVSIPQWCDCCRKRHCRTVPRRNCFNPTMVRLLPFCCFSLLLLSLQFQSHNGAIAAQKRKYHGEPTHQFQSHNGAIAAQKGLRTRQDKTLFQSHNGAIAATATVQCVAQSSRFQSHNGAIAALSAITNMLNLRLFQSHNGAIAASCNTFLPLSLRSFNPTMVRLLPLM